VEEKAREYLRFYNCVSGKREEIKKRRGYKIAQHRVEKNIHLQELSQGS